MYVIGTAGHVDHGKTTLVKAITGMETDRLSEEKNRGLSIDLGFAWLELPNGLSVSFIDVPGHKKFIANMLAGAGAIDLALIVIAADESVMPQTLEHFQILNLLGVKRSVVALTKCDLVDEQWLDLVKSDVEKMLKGSLLENSKIFPVSSINNKGLEEMITAIGSILKLSDSKVDIGKPRLWVDRSFSKSGFGTVVTGTLLDGNLTVGDDVELVLSDQTSRIRGLQVHNEVVDLAKPGERVAVNLSNVNHNQIQRGDVLSKSGLLGKAFIVDAKLHVLHTYPNAIKNNMSVNIHTGTNECITKIRLIESNELNAGDTGYVQLKFDRPLVISRGDHFVIRTNMFTLGGGVVLDLNPKRHKRGDVRIINRLGLISHGSINEMVKVVLEDNGPLEVEMIEKQLKIGILELKEILGSMLDDGELISIVEGDSIEKSIVVTSSGWVKYTNNILKLLERYHLKFPLRVGIARAELRQELDLTPKLFNVIINKLTFDCIVEDKNKFVSKFGYEPVLTRQQTEIIDAYLLELKQKRYSPSIDIKIDDDILVLLENQNRVVRISESIIYHYDVYCEMVQRIKNHLELCEEISVGEVRDMFKASRKYALALMEYLDAQHFTKRIGDKRVLL
ncbi:MAG: selenocysteine-specific translation elongation factor [SAR202 cluster bacterium]|nr:selenocysteine-specific translation elongation factor [SAR202 cluster bacterium]